MQVRGGCKGKIKKRWHGSHVAPIAPVIVRSNGGSILLSLRQRGTRTWIAP